MKRDLILRRMVKVMLMVLGVMVGQNVWADDGWSIGASHDDGTNITTFTISRTNTAVAETVRYRLVNLSAFAGQHYSVTEVANETSSDMSGYLYFSANEGSKTIKVQEKTPTTDAYRYQTMDTKRKYKLQVTDLGGFFLAENIRSFTTGTSINSSNVYAMQSVSVNNGGEIKVTDDNYSQAYHPVSVSNYYSAAAPKAYLEAAGAELRMTLSLQAKESDDGYQHVQILVNQTSNHDEGAGNNNPGTMNYSSYMACFVHEGGSTNTTYSNYVFPDVNHGSSCGNVGKVWTSINSTNNVGELRQQYFNTNCRASDDGRLIIASKSALSSFVSLGIRFDASGDNKDTWYAYNTQANIQAVDNTAPTSLATTVDRGYHAKGDTVYVSIAFSEIVKVSGTPVLNTTSWGNLSYYEGSGTNVLTFKGIISDSASGSLSITGKSGTISDLAGNSFTWTGTVSLNTSLDDDYTYSISYDLNGGSVATANPTSYKYTTSTFTLTNPSRTGYDFVGWTGSNGSTASTTVQINHSHGHKSYTANWTPTTYTITYNLNGGSVATSNPATYTIESDPITLVNPTKTGYTFLGWTVNDGNTLQTEVTINTGSTGIMTYTANWKAHTYTVHFDIYDNNNNNGIAISGSMSDQQFTYDHVNALTSCAFTRQGYNFRCWTAYINGNVRSFNDGQEISNLTDVDGATVTLYAQWDVIPWTGSGDSEQDPYLIIYPSQLLKLADDVNSGTDYSGKFFQLGGNINMNGVQFYGIGTTSRTYFSGTFNGAGYTISNLTINNGYSALFLYLSGGTVKKLTLDHAHTGGDFVSVLVYSGSNSTIQDCLVLNSSITTTDQGSIICGRRENNTTLVRNYYLNCSYTYGGSSSSTTGIGTFDGDQDGARSLHTLTLPANVTATGETVEIDNVTYFAAGTTVTLSISVPGATITGATYNDGSDHDATINSDGTWSFIMPAAYAIVTATAKVPYIDADGVEQECTDFTVIQSSNGFVGYGNQDNDKAWYVVSGDVTINDHLMFDDKAVHLILCDGASFTISNEDYALETYNGSLTIYGQAQQSGKLTATSTSTYNSYHCAINVREGDLTVNGGNVNATSVTGAGIQVGGADIIINRGNVSATSTTSCAIVAGRYGTTINGNTVYTGGFITINGGTVSATGGSGNSSYGIGANGDLTINGGTVSATSASDAGIKVYNGNLLTINSGIVSATGNSYGIYAYGNIVINSGSVSTTSTAGSAIFVNRIGTNIDDNIVYVGGNLTINGGTVSATGGSGNSRYGIGANGNITLGWTNPTDHIYASSYFISENGSISVKSGQALTEGSYAYSGTLNASDIKGKTLWPDLWGVADGNNGNTAETAFTITTTGGLDQLAARVNSGNGFRFQYFRLGNDITYTHTTAWDDANSTENNYTAIGGCIKGSTNNNMRYFSGTFDGQGYTISGIRIYKGDATIYHDYQGLFGAAHGATIKNVILADARITGWRKVGGIVGDITENEQTGSVENCRVGSDVTIHAAVNAASNHGGVVGTLTGGSISGCVSAATLTVADGLTVIYNYGGIVGMLSSNMSDCLAIGATVPVVTSDYGVIAGNIDTEHSTQTNCYYQHCTRGANSDWSNAYTVSAGTDVTLAPAGNADLTYPHNGIQRYGNVLYYNGVLYAPKAANVSFTLGYNGSVPTGLSVGYTASVGTLIGSANHPYFFTMPDRDVTINAFFGVPVSYIDENGVEDIAIAIPLDNTMTTLAAGTYVVNSNVTYTDNDSYTSIVTTTGDVTLILADGCTMSVVTESQIAPPCMNCEGHHLTIYGQAQGTGWLKAYSGPGSTIQMRGYIQHSGNVCIRNNEASCIYGSDFTLLGGTLDVLSDGNCSGDIEAYNINILGGQLWARGRGLHSYSNITLGWTNPTDLIYAQEYNANDYPSTIIANGQILVDEHGNTCGGPIYIPGEIAERTLSPLIVTGVTFETKSGNLIATFDGTSTETVNIPVNIIVNRVIYNRTFTAGKASTVMLPFNYTCNGSEGGTFYHFVGVEKDNENKWVATMQETANKLIANTPYLFMPTGTTLTFPNDEYFVLNTTGGGNCQTADAGSHWTFKGTYDYIKWTSDTGDQDYSAEREAEIGKVYGFAGEPKNGINVGDFVKVSSGAKIRPMSAYLMWSDTPNSAHAINRGASEAEELPSRITVRLLDVDGVLTNVGQIDIVTGEVSFEGWYTLQGVKLDAEPTQPGIYINNGKKVSIK